MHRLDGATRRQDSSFWPPFSGKTIAPRLECFSLYTLSSFHSLLLLWTAVADNYKVMTHMIMIHNVMICIDSRCFMYLWSLYLYMSLCVHTSSCSLNLMIVVLCYFVHIAIKFIITGHKFLFCKIRLWWWLMYVFDMRFSRIVLFLEYVLRYVLRVSTC